LFIRAAVRHTADRALMAGGRLHFVGNALQEHCPNCDGSAFMGSQIDRQSKRP